MPGHAWGYVVRKVSVHLSSHCFVLIWYATKQPQSKAFDRAADAEALWWAELELVSSLPPPRPDLGDASPASPILTLNQPDRQILESDGAAAASSLSNSSGEQTASFREADVSDPSLSRPGMEGSSADLGTARVLTQHQQNESSSPSAVVKAETESADQHSSAKSALKAMVSGGLAGAMAKTCIAPADRIKILYQVRIFCSVE